MTAGVNDMEITLFLVGTDPEDAQLHFPFDSFEAAASYANDNPGTSIFSVAATIDFTTIEATER